MKAIRVKEFGGPDVLRLEEIETPRPEAGQALVRLAVAGVNFVDVYYRRGSLPATVSHVAFPFTPGLEGSGVVEAVGGGVTNVKPGDRVAYTHQLGAYAEASVVEAESLIPLPNDFSFEQGAAFPLQGLTAHFLMTEFRLPKPGDVVLIHAAAGGMGLLLVQWARHLGARVTGTVSTEEKAKVARAAGANDLIFYTQRDFATETMRLTGGHGADLIFDGVGKTTFAGNLEAAAVRGHIIIYGLASGRPDPIAPESLRPRSLTVSGGALRNYMRTREELMRRASDVIEAIRAGWLRLRINRILPLGRAADVHRALENRQTTGKLLLRINA
jgi:NADPH2:quinone reductase